MKKRTPLQSFRRWRRRMERKHSWAPLAFVLCEAAMGFLAVMVVFGLILLATR